MEHPRAWWHKKSLIRDSSNCSLERKAERNVNGSHNLVKGLFGNIDNLPVFISKCGAEISSAEFS
jgi:hypothetical protein